MAINHFSCPACKKMTKHIELSLREISAISGESISEELGCGIMDYMGITKTASFLSGRRFWKCCECGTATTRSASGEIKRIWNNYSDCWF